MMEEIARATEEHRGGAGPQDRLSSNSKAGEHIRISPFARYLDEVGITTDPELLLESYVDLRDSHGLRGEVLLNTLSNTFPELREALATEADREGFLERCVGYSRTKKKAKKTESGDMLIFKPSVEDGGELYEEIYHDGQALFIDAEGITHEMVELDGIKYAPLSGDELTEGAVLLPSGCGEYEDEKDLIELLRAHIHRYVDVPPFFETISAYYILLTWLYDELNTLPYLRALGDTGTGKSRFLDVVGRLCYRATMVSGAVTPAPIYRLIRRWHGTIVIDEGDFRQSDEQNEVVKILNCGFERGRPVVRSQKDQPDNLQILPTFGPKIISSRRRFKDVALESRCLTEIMKETGREDVPYLLPRRFYEEEARLRNQLLAFRFRNHGTVDIEKAQALDGIDVENRLKQAVSSFVVLFATNEEVFTEFKKFLCAYNADLVEERSQTYEGAIVAALFDRVPCLTDSHTDGTLSTNGTFTNDDSKGVIITPADLTELLIQKYGFEKANPRTVGKLLRTLGIETEQRKVGDAKRRVLLLDASHLRKLRKKYIPRTESGSTIEDKSTVYKGDCEKRYRNVCDRCGEHTETTLCNGELLCERCLNVKVSREDEEAPALRDTILAYVARFTEQDSRGAYVDALTARVAKETGELRTDVTAVLERLVASDEVVTCTRDGLTFLRRA